MEFLPPALKAFAPYTQFIVYTEKKVPADYRTGAPCNAHDPNMWTNATTAINAAKNLGNGTGVGFVFTDNDPFFFLDIDNCRDGDSWSPLALTLFAMLPGAACEVSVSGNGLHLFGSTADMPLHVCKNTGLAIELYHTKRYVALTGVNACGDASVNFDAMLPELVAQYFPTAETTPPAEEWNTDAPEDYTGETDDHLLITKALNEAPSAHAVFGKGITFRQLYEGDSDALAKCYPPQNKESAYDESSADLALATKLAWYTGNHHDRILVLMWGSVLCRDKWYREDYLRRTISRACRSNLEWPKRKPDANNKSVTVDSQHSTPAKGFITAAQQVELFKNCVYVKNENKIYTGDWDPVSRDVFNNIHGGYRMPLDADGAKVTRYAWEAFLQSSINGAPAMVETTGFFPRLPHRAIITHDYDRVLNIYRPLNTPKIEGDASRFLRLLELMLPDERDRLIVTSYLAAILQNRGVKFQWCIVLQGVQGNGKTFISRAMEHAIGEKYTHIPNSSEIGGKFNAWMYCKELILVEDLNVRSHRDDTMEALKPMITSKRLEIEKKGQDKFTREVCANFILNTNHKDGVIKAETDRRFAVFYTAQQTLDDLNRDGMGAGGRFFTDLYGWAEKHDGYSIINHYLQTFEIPSEFNPATDCQRAPVTSSTPLVLALSRSVVEIEIEEAIDSGVQGFRGGWVSSHMLEKYLQEKRLAHRLSRSKRRDLLQGLGYVMHPMLVQGRAISVVMPDGVKSTLYVKVGSKNHDIVSNRDIEKAYTDAQN